MKTFDNFLKSRSSQRVANNKHIREAMRDMTPRTADLIFDLSNGDKGTKSVDINRRAHIKAIELVSNLITSFHLPVRPKLAYEGMIKEATDNGGNITDGVVRIGVVLRTLMGHKMNIDVPVIVRNASLVEPAVFFFQQAPYVMCGSALEELVKRGSLRKELQPRRMFSPPSYGQPMHPDDYPRTPITNQDNMFSPGARNPWTFRRYSSRDPKMDVWLGIDASLAEKKTPNNPQQRDQHIEDWMYMDKSAQHKGTPRERTNIDTPTEMTQIWPPSVPDEMLDTSERSRDGLFEPGAMVSLEKDIQARSRGGGNLVVPSGEEGMVLRDLEGDGKMLYVEFPHFGLAMPVPSCMLKSAATTSDQVKYEIKQMIREGYPTVDIKEAIARRYPDYANEALQGID